MGAGAAATAGAGAGAAAATAVALTAVPFAPPLALAATAFAGTAFAFPAALAFTAAARVGFLPPAGFLFLALRASCERGAVSLEEPVALEALRGAALASAAEQAHPFLNQIVAAILQGRAKTADWRRLLFVGSTCPVEGVGSRMALCSLAG